MRCRWRSLRRDTSGRPISGKRSPGNWEAIFNCFCPAWPAVLVNTSKKETAVGFWTRAHAFFTQAGITVERVLTDNGSCYRSYLWRNSLATRGISHKRTRPYRPQTNGKVERFNRTLLEEWAYTKVYRTEAERRDAYPQWLHTYNHHRGHTALKGQPPASRIPNLTGQNN